MIDLFWKGWLLVHGFCLVADVRCSCYSLLLHCWLRLDIFRFKPWKEPSSHRCCALDDFFSQVLQSEAYHTSSSPLLKHAFTLTKVTEYNAWIMACFGHFWYVYSLFTIYTVHMKSTMVLPCFLEMYCGNTMVYLPWSTMWIPCCMNMIMQYHDVY